MDIKTVRKNSIERKIRKRKVMKYIIAKDIEMKESTHDFDVNELLEENGEYDDAPWTTYVHSLQPALYDK